MDEDAPITWLINQIDSIVISGAAATAAAISTAVTPVVASCFGIYMLLMTVGYARGATSEHVWDFWTRAMSWVLIIGIGLNAANYAAVVIPIVTGLGSDLANAVSGGGPTAGALDQLALHYLKILDDGYEAANSPMFPFNVGPLLLYLLKALLIIVCLVPFLVAATLAMVAADVGGVMVASVGPLFFGFLLFPATRQYFSAWMNTALSYALIPLFVAVIAGLSVTMSKAMFTARGAANLSEASLKTVFLASMGNLVLLFLVKQVGALASSLSAGGINAAMPGGLGALAGAMRSGMAGTWREMRGAAAGYRGAREGARALRERLANRNNGIENRKAG